MSLDRYCAEVLEDLRRTAPLIHNITNYVVMNSAANILLAAGASPVMAHCRAEVEEMASFAGAVVLNIGTLQEDWVDAMILAARAANAKGIPVVLDPVGAGATTLRTEAVKRILRESRISVLRGNASEIFSLRSADIKTRGVDSALDFSDEMIAAAKAMAREMACVIAISGPEDCITDGERVFRVGNGHPLMTRVTGMGCGLSSMVGAFCAVDASDVAKATAAAFAYYGLCGDLAVQVSDKPGSFFVAFLDQLFAVDRTVMTGQLKLRQSA